MIHYQFIAAWARAHAKTERGASLVEYALLVALIAVVCVAAIQLLGDRANDNFKNIADAITTTTASP